jgi:outer membrane immunogenic protein
MHANRAAAPGAFPGAFLGTFLLLAGAVGASAADIIEQPPQGDVTPPQTQPLLWSGLYTGLYGGYVWLDSSAGAAGSVDHLDGLVGGAYAGVNYQNPSNWIAGIEGMAGVSGADSSTAGLTVTQDWEASLRGRMGYAFENSMIYGLAGLAGAKFDVSNAAGSDSNMHLGWQIGAGMETFLTKNVTARVEYNFSDYGARDYNLGGGPASVDASGHAIRLGVGVKF